MSVYYKPSDKSCHYCGEHQDTHDRCKKCEVLLHDYKKSYVCRCGKQHTLRDGDLCQDCANR